MKTNVIPIEIKVTPAALCVLLGLAVLLGALGVLLWTTGAVTAMESDHYALNWSVMGGGGQPSASAHYALNATVGQPSIGFKSSDNYRACSGFWCSGAYQVYLPVALRNS